MGKSREPGGALGWDTQEPRTVAPGGKRQPGHAAPRPPPRNLAWKQRGVVLGGRGDSARGAPRGLRFEYEDHQGHSGVAPPEGPGMVLGGGGFL